MTEGDPAGPPQQTRGSYQPLTHLPAPPLAEISPEHQEMVPVGRAEITQFAKEVRALKDPMASTQEWTFLWAGAGLAGLITLIAAAFDHASAAPIAIYAAITFIGGFLAIYLNWFGDQVKQTTDTRADDIAARLGQLNERAPTTVAKQESREQAP